MRKSFLTILILGFVYPILALGYTKVINNIVNSVNTGGNSAGSGEIIEGEAEVEIRVYTEINGKILEDIDESFNSDTGEIEVKVESKTEIESNGQAETESKVEINDEESVITPQVEMSKTDFDIKPEVGFWTKVKEILKNVFTIFTF